MSDNFSKKFLDSQKTKLLQLREQIMNSLREASREDIEAKPDQTTEEGDLAQAILDQNVTFGLREKEIFKLREIEAALGRIENGTYGYCEETDEPIEQKRLEKIPWARYSIAAAEELERNTVFRRAI